MDKMIEINCEGGNFLIDTSRVTGISIENETHVILFNDGRQPIRVKFQNSELHIPKSIWEEVVYRQNISKLFTGLLISLALVLMGYSFYGMLNV